MSRLHSFSVSLLFVAAACQDPTQGKPAAAVSEASPPAAQATVPARPAQVQGALAFDQQSSRIEMVGSKVTGSHDVKVTDFQGSIQLADGAAIESGHVEVVMQMGSVEADHAKLTKHLRGGDFFLVDKHPTSTFKSTAIEKGDDKGASHTVTGELTLRGVTKVIRFPASITREGKGVRVRTEFSINRKDFGIAYAGRADDLIRDDVLIKLDLKAG